MINGNEENVREIDDVYLQAINFYTGSFVLNRQKENLLPNIRSENGI